LSNSLSKIHIHITGHGHVGEPNAAGKSKISNRPIAVVFKGKTENKAA
jgi:hypothetical protein